jgi:myo-inositol-1(or 4)-monophosphatase
VTRYLAVPLELRDLAVSLAQSAGRQLLTMRQSMLVTETKSSGSDWVSNADRAVEDRLVGMLTDTRPCDGILGEERTTRRSTSGLTWIIDPLDGTTNYLRGYPGWSVSVAVEAGGSPLAGAVHDPSTSMTYAAAADRGATLNGSHSTFRGARS